MNLEERVSELERIVNLLLQKDKEVDKFNKEILDAVKEIDSVVNRSIENQTKYAEVIRGIVVEIQNIQSKISKV
jgi:predicted DNA-binding ArsR family transcriptional regulator